MMKALEKRLIPRMNESVTFLGFGALSIGRDWGMWWGQDRGIGEDLNRPQEKEAIDVLHQVLDLGINLIDTASAYHRSEDRIGKALSNRRNEFILASKCGEHNREPDTYYDFSYQAIRNSIDRSLELLQTNQIDIMQIHFGPDPEKVIADGETLAAMQDAKNEGKIRFLGASIDGKLATKCIQSGAFDVMQMEYHLLNRHNEENIRLCEEAGIGVFIRRGLAGGRLTERVNKAIVHEVEDRERILKLLDLVNNDGEKLTALALQFLYQNRGIHSVLVGTKKLNHLRQNMDLLDLPIEPEIMKQAIFLSKDRFTPFHEV